MAEDSVPSSTSIKKEVLESWISTEIQVFKHHRYTWTINNFCLCLFSKKLGEKLQSPTFSTGTNGNGLEWRLELYPNGTDEGSRNAIGFYLELVKCSTKTIKINFNLGIVNAKGENCRIINKDSTEFAVGTSWGTETRLGFRKFGRKNEYLSDDDKLTIFCEIIGGVTEEDLLGTLTTTPQSDLAKDFKYLLEHKDLCDVTLCIGRKKIKAHKIILMARSPVFRGMLQQNMKQRKNYRVKITDIDEEGLCEMLRYMYTGEIRKLKEMAPRLLGIAEKYAMEDLKSTCEKALFESLSVENAAEIFILGDKFNSKELKDQAKKFIIAHASDVVKTPGFKSMVGTYPHLGIEAFCIINN